jgi:hypothetical protein
MERKLRTIYSNEFKLKAVELSNKRSSLLAVAGGAGGLEHIRPELQINRGRIFLTTSIMELTQC